MNNTKKGFLRAGTILSIIFAILTVFMSVGMLSASGFINEDIVLDSFRAEKQFTLYEDVDGGYYFEYIDVGDIEDPSDDTLITMYDYEVESLSKFIKIGLIVVSAVTLCFNIAQFIIAMLILTQTNKEKVSTGLIITMLTLSALSGNFITMAFMIVALSIKNEPKQIIEDEVKTIEV